MLMVELCLSSKNIFISLFYSLKREAALQHLARLTVSMFKYFENKRTF